MWKCVRINLPNTPQEFHANNKYSHHNLAMALFGWNNWIGFHHPLHPTRQPMTPTIYACAHQWILAMPHTQSFRNIMKLSPRISTLQESVLRVYISNLSPNLLPTFLITLISLVLGSNPIPTCIKVWLWSPFSLVILDSGRAFTSLVAGSYRKVLSHDSNKQKIPLQQSTTRIAASIFSVNSMCLIAEA